MPAPISPTDILFSSEQQLAVLGHAITNKKVYETCCALGVTPTWFNSANHQSIWKALDDFCRQNNYRLPTLVELKSTPAFKNEEQRIIQKRLDALQLALDTKKEMDFTSIVKDLREWARGQTFVKAMEESARLFNAHDVGASYNVTSDMIIDMERIAQAGLEARALYSPERARVEREGRVEQRGRAMKFGVEFLDEATAGIGANDLILIGAKTGVGKTQLVTRIAAKNARMGKRVALFSLEAENNEIERRLKFGFLVQHYTKDFPFSHLPLNYRDWRRGAFLEELDPYEDKVNEYIDKNYSTLRTIYKGWGEYKIGELERDIMRMANETDLFIIDHLHYIDTDGEDNNHEMKQIVKVLRDLALFLNKPIIVVAHMRKTFAGRKNAPVIPDLEDFHGSSDVIKIATTAVILSPCYENFELFDTDSEGKKAIPDSFFEDDARQRRARLWATYARIAKCRIDGSVTRYCAIAFFDDTLGYYRPEYALGRLTSGDTAWEPEKVEHLPHWAKNAVLTGGMHGTND